jgi:ubiquinone/menaquinone biosynthesis C-methylase UbiE
VDKEIREFYDKYDEDSRLKSGDGSLEFERSKDIIHRYLSGHGLNILDVGGGTGPYSFWLSSLGHKVHLLDASSKHIDVASSRSTAGPNKLFSVSLGEAEMLPFAENEFDVVLLMGPLYHLHEPADREGALQEAKRVLRPGGLLFSAYISRFASLLDGYQSNYMRDPEFQGIVRGDLETGKHRGSRDGSPRYFTNAYLHRPQEIKGEAQSVGLNVIDLLAVESFGWLIPEFEKYWCDGKEKSVLLANIAALEKEESILGLSAHMLLVSRK